MRRAIYDCLFSHDAPFFSHTYIHQTEDMDYSDTESELASLLSQFAISREQRKPEQIEKVMPLPFVKKNSHLLLFQLLSLCLHSVQKSVYRGRQKKISVSCLQP